MAEHTVLKTAETTVELSDGAKLYITRRLVDFDAGYADDTTYEEIELKRIDDDDVVVFLLVGDDAEKFVKFLNRKF